MGIKSNDTSQPYYNFFGETGKGAAGQYVRAETIVATGGTKTTSGDWAFHEFAISPTAAGGTFSVTSAPGSANFYYLVVGGGGGGGNSGVPSGGGAGGGGAGGLLSNHPSIPAPLRGSAYPLAAGDSRSVTLGVGGAGGNGNNAPGKKGLRSILGAQGRAFSRAKAYSVYNGGSRGANYTVQYSDDNSNWVDAFTGVMSSNRPADDGGPYTSCGLKTASGGGGDYGRHQYWRYVEGPATDGHHPRVSRVLLTTTDGTDVTLVTYTSDNCSDSGTYAVGTIGPYSDPTYSAGPLSAEGGGYGAGNVSSPNNGGAGGSGGGGGYTNGNGGPAPTPQGNGGGGACPGSPYGGGGGGGAGGAGNGCSGPDALDNVGGVGLEVTWDAPTPFSKFYAGGGGGGSFGPNDGGGGPAAGGNGGGGAGAENAGDQAVAGTDGLGGGGGGGAYPGRDGKDGGNGIVIISYDRYS